MIASQTQLRERIDVLLTALQQNWATTSSQSLQGHQEPAFHHTVQATHFVSPTPDATGSSAPSWPTMPSQMQPMAAPQTEQPDFVPPPQQASHRPSIYESGAQLQNYDQQPSVASSTMSIQYASRNENTMYPEGGEFYAPAGMSAHHQSSQSISSGAMQQKYVYRSTRAHEAQ